MKNKKQNQNQTQPQPLTIDAIASIIVTELTAMRQSTFVAYHNIVVRCGHQSSESIEEAIGIARQGRFSINRSSFNLNLRAVKFLHELANSCNIRIDTIPSIIPQSKSLNLRLLADLEAARSVKTEEQRKQVFTLILNGSFTVKNLVESKLIQPKPSVVKESTDVSIQSVVARATTDIEYRRALVEALLSMDTPAEIDSAVNQ